MIAVNKFFFTSSMVLFLFSYCLTFFIVYVIWYLRIKEMRSISQSKISKKDFVLNTNPIETVINIKRK